MIPDSTDSETEDIPSDERNRSYTDSDNEKYQQYQEQEQDSPVFRPRRSRFLSDQEFEFNQASQSQDKNRENIIKEMSIDEVKNKVKASIQSLLDSNFDISEDIPEWIFDIIVDKEKVDGLEEDKLRDMLCWFQKNRVNAYTFC